MAPFSPVAGWAGPEAWPPPPLPLLDKEVKGGAGREEVGEGTMGMPRVW